MNAQSIVERIAPNEAALLVWGFDMNPLTKTARNNVRANEMLNRDNLLISIGCGVVFAALVIAFLL